MTERTEKNQERRVLPLCLLLILLSVAAAVVSLAVGRYSQVTMQDVLHTLGALLSGGADLAERNTGVIVQLRLPRAVAAIFIGTALAASGAAYQALFANPIASPDTLGVTQGASFGAVLGILLGLGSFQMKFLSFAIGCLVVTGVFFLAQKVGGGRNLTFYLLLVGMIASSIFQALVSFVKYTADADDQLPQITYWLMGSLSKITLGDLPALILLFLAGFIPLMLVRWRLNLLMLTPAEAQSMGVDVHRLRLVTIVCATLLTAVATSLAGGISWFGLIVPHMARYLAGNDFKKLLPVSAAMGSLFLLLMDMAARTVSVQELPISILTSLVGAPLFVVVLLGKWRTADWR